MEEDEVSMSQHELSGGVGAEGSSAGPHVGRMLHGLVARCLLYTSDAADE